MKGGVFWDGGYNMNRRVFQDVGYEYEWRSVIGWWI